MISAEEVKIIHERLIELYGGIQGVRDNDLLDSALNRPFTTFDGKLLYPTPIDKAAALVESLIKNHPFHDGNKRVAYTLMRIFLYEAGIEFKVGLNERYKFILSIAKSEMGFEAIIDWLKANTG